MRLQFLVSGGERFVTCPLFSPALPRPVVMASLRLMSCTSQPHLFLSLICPVVWLSLQLICVIYSSFASSTHLSSGFVEPAAHLCHLSSFFRTHPDSYYVRGASRSPTSFFPRYSPPPPPPAGGASYLLELRSLVLKTILSIACSFVLVLSCLLCV